jgi:hypothetical protein
VQADGGVTTGADAGVLPLSDAGPRDASDRADAESQVDQDAGSPDKTGSIFAISDTQPTSDGGLRSAYRAGASFRRTLMPDMRVATKTIGPCLVETFGEGASAKEERLSAGILHIEGGASAIEITPAVDKSYAAASGRAALWNGGEMLSVRAEGGDVPAFTATLVAPSPVTLTLPLVKRSALTVTRSMGLRVMFSGASSGDAVFYFDANTAQSAVAATCAFKAIAGAGEIPAAAFAGFPAGAGTFDFYVKETVTAMPAGVRVRFTASKAIIDSAGAPQYGSATFD